MKKATNHHPEYLFSKIKSIILFIYSFECQFCGKASVNNHIHHIDKNHKNNNPLNLTCLCVECHQLTHSTLKITYAKSSPKIAVNKLKLLNILRNFNYKL
jgi:5-methylcytosine-specific restriction endonuclease McrA